MPLCVSHSSCPTLCNHMDCNPPGSFVHGILQARILGWEPFPSPGYLPNPGIEPGFPPLLLETSLVAHTVKHLPTMRRPGFNPWVGRISWRRKWQPTPLFLPGESHGQRSLVGYSPWGHKELDTTERLHFLSLSCIAGRFFII